MRSAPFEIVTSSAGTPPGNESVGEANAIASTSGPSVDLNSPYPGANSLSLGARVLMDLECHHPARDRPRGAVERLVDLRDVDLFEGVPGDVLGSVHVADLRVRRHDHRERSVEARLPGSLGGEDESVDLVIEHALAQVPHRPVVGLRVEIDRRLLQAAVEEGHVLRDQHAHALAGRPFDDLRERQECGLGVEDLAVDVSVEDRRLSRLIGNSGLVTEVGSENGAATRSRRAESGARGRSPSPAASSIAWVGCGTGVEADA